MARLTLLQSFYGVLALLLLSLRWSLKKILKISYTYISEWVQTEGGAKMDIALSNRIEIRLEPVGEEWKPASSSDTISHLFKSENRLEQITAPKKPLFKTGLVYSGEVPPSRIHRPSTLCFP